MARSTARQRRLSKARDRSVPATSPATDNAERIDRQRLLQAAALLLLVAVLAALAVRGRDKFSLNNVVLLVIAMVLFQAAVLAIAFVRSRSDGAEVRHPPRLAVLVIAVMAGAGLAITGGLPFGGWLAGVAMFACFVADAVTRRRGRLAWAPLAFGVALAVCWVFASMREWDVLLWWSFLLAAFAAVALNSATTGSAQNGRQPVLTRRTLGGVLAAVGLFCSTAALVLVWRAPGAAVLIAIEGAFALLFIQRAARRFGQQGVLGSAAAACVLGAAVFVAAI
jgi:hypothetical protein